MSSSSVAHGANGVHSASAEAFSSLASASSSEVTLSSASLSASSPNTTALPVKPQVSEILEQKHRNQKLKEVVQTEFIHQYQRVQENARKLEIIRLELSKLDLVLMSNIDLLRNEIEIEDRALSEARTNYKRIEQEYVQAKKELERRGERKRLLTEHLDLIILTNEREKAHKLHQLMEKLGIEDDGLTMSSFRAARVANLDDTSSRNTDSSAQGSARAASGPSEPVFMGFSAHDASNDTL